MISSFTIAFISTLSANDMFAKHIMKRNKKIVPRLVITDAMNMGAIAKNYDSGIAAKMAVKAGVDMVLMPSDFQAAYSGLYTAVLSGEISEDRIDESVRRILTAKISKLS